MKQKFKRIISTMSLIALSFSSTAIFTTQIAFAAAPQGTLTGSTQSLTAGTTSAINTLTLTDFSTAEITAVNDIRIKIPASVNAVWDSSDTNVDVTGTGSVNVASTVSYADSDKTLILDVTGDFSNSDTLILSGLSYIGQAASTAAALTWSIDGGATYGTANSNTNLTVSAADAAGAVTITTPSVAGSGTTVLALTIPIALAAGDTISWTMPAWMTVTQGALTVSADTFVGTFTCAGVNATRVITCTASGAITAATGTITLAAGSTTANYVSTGTNAITNLLVYDTSLTANIATDSTVSITTTTVGALSSTNVEPTALQVGSSTTATVSFTTVTSIPNLGKIVVTFPSGYNVAGANGTTASSLSGLDGTWTASVSGQVVTLTQTGGGATAAGAKSLILSGIVTPGSSGSTGTYTITTTIAAGNNIETDAAVTADTITGGGGSSSSTPPTNTSASVVGAPSVTTTNVQLTLAATGASQMRISNNANFTDANWESYATSKNWTLMSGDGAKIVYVQFRDQGQNVSPVLQANVILATTTTTSPAPASSPAPIPATTTTPATPTPSTTPAPSTTTTPTPITGFTDTNNHWAADFIKDLFVMGAVSGKTSATFAPDDSLTRAEMVKIAVLTFKVEVKDDAKSSLKDVKEGDWFTKYVAAAQAKGMVSGYKDGTFKPNEPVNRAEALKILLIASGKDLGDLKTGMFTDVLASSWFAKYVNYAQTKGIVSGKTSTTFAPGDNITRAEMAKMAVLASKL